MWENGARYYHSLNDTHIEKLHEQIITKVETWLFLKVYATNSSFVIPLIVNYEE